MAAKTVNQLFETSAPQTAINLEKAMALVQRATGKSKVQQLAEIRSIRNNNPYPIEIPDYYLYGLFWPGRTAQDKAAYVSANSCKKLNRELVPPGVRRMEPLIDNKILLPPVLNGAGLPTLRIQALVSTVRGRFGMIRLQTPADVAAFLQNDAEYPLFGKPINASRAIGGVWISGITPDKRELILKNGDTISLALATDQIFEHFSEGYLFQDALQQHDAFRALAGDTAVTFRISTLKRLGESAYVAWTTCALPGSSGGGVSRGKGKMYRARVDLDTGRLNAARAEEVSSQEVVYARQPDTGVQIEGLQVPFWEQAKKLAVDAHNLFPGQSIIGFDCMFGKDGPVVGELNSSPLTNAAQIAFGHGLRHEKLWPHFQAILDQNKRLAERRLATAAPKPLTLRDKLRLLRGA